MYSNLFFLEMMKNFQPTIFFNHGFNNQDSSKASSAYQQYLMTMQKMMIDCYHEYNSLLCKISEQNSKFFTSANNSSGCPFTAYSNDLYHSMIDNNKKMTEHLTADANDLLSEKIKLMNESFNELTMIFKDKSIQDYLKLDDKGVINSLFNIFDKFKSLSDKVHNKGFNYVDDATKKFQGSVKEFYELVDKLKKNYQAN